MALLGGFVMSFVILLFIYNIKTKVLLRFVIFLTRHFLRFKTLDQKVFSSFSHVKLGASFFTN